MAREHRERQDHEEQQRRQDADRVRGMSPPDREHDPRHGAGGGGDRRQLLRGALDEDGAVQDDEQRRQAPQGFRRKPAARKEEQHQKAGDQHDAAAPPRHDRTAGAAGDHRDGKCVRAERAVERNRGAQVIDRQMRRGPRGLSRQSEKSRDEMRPECPTGHRAPCDQRQQREQRRKQPERRIDGRLDSRDHGEDEQQRRRRVRRARRHSGQRPAEARGDERRNQEQHDEGARERDGGRPCAVGVRHSEPHGEDQHRGGRANRVRELVTARDRERQQPAVDNQQESEEQRRPRAVLGDRGQIGREEQRHDGGGQAVSLEPGLAAGRVRRPRAEDQPDQAHHRKDEEDPHRQRELVGGEELTDPAPLIDRREDERQCREHRPALLVRHPGEADVQQQQIGEERHRPVFAGRQQDRRREATEQAEDGDEERVAPDGQEHGHRGHEGQQPEGGGGGDQIPQRVRREECGKKNRDRRCVERVRGHRIPARRFHVADNEQGDAGERADRDPDRRRQPAVVDRVAEEEHRGQHQRDAGHRGEHLDADELLPVDPRGGRWFRSGRTRRDRHRRRRGRALRRSGHARR